MKKVTKILVVALTAILVVSAVCVLSACGSTYKGEYSYQNYGHTYGCKVSVTVKNGIVSKIDVTPDTEEFFNLSPEGNGWTEANRKNWQDHQAALINSLVGQTVENINKIHVECNDIGQPNAITGAPSAVQLVTGATQSTGRLILAVQDALKNVK